MTNEMEAEFSGYDAYWVGKLLEDCPYFGNTAYTLRWQEGWHEAQEEHYNEGS